VVATFGVPLEDERDVAPMEALGDGHAVSGDDLVDGIGQLLQVTAKN
jgi:hypothetical protein